MRERRFATWILALLITFPLLADGQPFRPSLASTGASETIVEMVWATSAMPAGTCDTAEVVCVPAWFGADAEECWWQEDVSLVLYNADRAKCGPAAPRPEPMRASPAATLETLEARVEFGNVLEDEGAVWACRRRGVARNLTCTPIDTSVHLPETTTGEIPTEEWVQSYLKAWEGRYGAPQLWGVSRGDHSPTQTPTRLLLASSAPLGITYRHERSQEEGIDGNLFSSQNQDRTVIRLLDRYADLIDGWPIGECFGEGCDNDTTVDACPPPWKCGAALPEVVRLGCNEGTLHCSETRGIPATDPRCYQEAGTVRGKPWVQVAPRCDWRVTPPSPLPPPPELDCDGGQPDGACMEREQLAGTCPEDCPVEPPQPPLPPTCEDAVRAAVAAERARWETWIADQPKEQP